MENERVAKRYAKSIFDLSKEKNLLDTIYQDFAHIQNLIRESKELRFLIQTPIINSIKKLEMLKKAFSNHFHNITITFLDILFRRHRESILPSVAEEFIKLYQKEKNITEVLLISASPLSEDFVQQLKNKIESKLQTQVIFQFKIEPEIIGGFILRFHGKEYDGSVASKLRKLKRQFQDISFVDQI